ncbi:hypothetical protein Pyn_04045 [Prunus yedoensis var. nudiflora]|uniref:Uncharacterized protein n=1 Tax=Prunus yedoensis var. nudiflora TaxID=2094558 RepID=A0A314Z309_PRUYE|nr:hypothetical protein Pyn_04045 [Prunus yedoensis var. nudiflora]
MRKRWLGGWSQFGVLRSSGREGATGRVGAGKGRFCCIYLFTTFFCVSMIAVCVGADDSLHLIFELADDGLHLISELQVSSSVDKLLTDALSFAHLFIRILCVRIWTIQVPKSFNSLYTFRFESIVAISHLLLSKVNTGSSHSS